MGGASAVADSQPGNFLDVNFAETGLNFDGRPLKLGVERVAQIVEEVMSETERDSTTNLRFEDVGLTVGIGWDTGLSTSEVTLNFGARTESDLTDHFVEIEREIDNKLAEKQQQADKMPTVLLLDFSRVGWAWLRSNPVWIATLRSKLQGQAFVGLGLMVSTLDSSLPLHLVAVLDPSAPSELHQAFERIAQVFNLTIEA